MWQSLENWWPHYLVMKKIPLCRKLIKNTLHTFLLRCQRWKKENGGNQFEIVLVISELLRIKEENTSSLSSIHLTGLTVYWGKLAIAQRTVWHVCSEPVSCTEKCFYETLWRRLIPKTKLLCRFRDATQYINLLQHYSVYYGSESGGVNAKNLWAWVNSEPSVVDLTWLCIDFICWYVKCSNCMHLYCIYCITSTPKVLSILLFQSQWSNSQQAYLQLSFLVTMGTEDRVVASKTSGESTSLLLLLLHCCRWWRNACK